MYVTTNDIVCRATTRHNSRNRNSNSTTMMRRHHPPNRGIMSPKMHFRDKTRADRSPARGPTSSLGSVGRLGSVGEREEAHPNTLVTLGLFDFFAP
jgi:hypothetical protein